MMNKTQIVRKGWAKTILAVLAITATGLSACGSATDYAKDMDKAWATYSKVVPDVKKTVEAATTLNDKCVPNARGAATDEELCTALDKRLKEIKENFPLAKPNVAKMKNNSEKKKAIETITTASKSAPGVMKALVKARDDAQGMMKRVGDEYFGSSTQEKIKEAQEGLARVGSGMGDAGVKKAADELQAVLTKIGDKQKNADDPGFYTDWVELEKELTDKGAGLGQAFGAWVKANPGNAVPAPSTASNDSNSGGQGQGSSQGSSRYGQRSAPRSGGNGGGARPAPQPAPAQPAKPAQPANNGYAQGVARATWITTNIGGQDDHEGYLACYDANGNKVYGKVNPGKVQGTNAYVTACWVKVTW
ncbi:hypothetical protein R6G85_06715 [Actinotignum urinale]|uniref:hypothetical protein n=1 Tax=Actinotignum urinale TaxID=190146 RepID=UPI002A828F7C|nr:hypothetical protein [Actinotignum urinale]MDY5152165.1 hypothetical protein [Actinotignum urinale]